MKRLRGKLTYANVISTLALFLVLVGGTAFAASQVLPKNSVGTKQIKNNAITVTKIKNGAVTAAKFAPGAIGTVSNATHATVAESADHAASAVHADSAGTATSSGNAAALGGIPAGGYAKRELEAEHFVGQPGQPPFENGCQNFHPRPIAEVGFYKDPMGVVHLRGLIENCTLEESMFILPPGFRPVHGEFFGVATGNHAGGLIEVAADGEIEAFGGTSASLSSVEFRTDG
jgi:hypothetical protein